MATTKLDVASIPLKRQAVLKRVLTHPGGTVVSKQSILHFASCTNPTCAQCKFVSNADVWSHKLPLAPDDGKGMAPKARRTWLQWREGQGAGCIACEAAGLRNPMAMHTINNHENLSLSHLLRHQTWASHIQAATAFVENAQELLAGAGAPSDEAFERLVDQLRKGVSASAGVEGVGEQKKLTKMIWCMREAIQDMDIDFLARSTCTTICRDERHGRLAIRYAAIDGDLNIRHGRLGQRRHFGTGAIAITNATRDVMVRATTARSNPPWGTPTKVPSAFSEASGEGN